MSELTNEALRLARVQPYQIGDVRVSGISLDSRRIKAGDLYVGLPGQHFHGARFAKAAAQAGALAVLTDVQGAELAADSKLPIVISDDPRAEMAKIACAIYQDPASKLLTFATTGTNGKTTVTFLLESALLHLGLQTGSIGTIGFRLGAKNLPIARSTVTTPESLDLQPILAWMLDHQAQCVAMEVSSHALALARVDQIRFDVAGFTNLGSDHLDFHHTQQAYFEAKAKLFTPEHTKRAVINIDDQWGQELVRRCHNYQIPVLTTGFSAQADYRIVEWHPARVGAEMKLCRGGQQLAFPIRLPGEYNVRNSATALAMLESVGIEASQAIAGISQASVPGRMQPIDLGSNAPRVYVDFAHTPQAIASALSAVENTAGKIIAVFGAGGDRDETKREPMGKAGAQGADIVIVTDDNPRTEDPAAIRRQVLAGAAQVGSTKSLDGLDRRHAIKLALEMADKDDCVLVLGKGHETTQQIGDETIQFDDVQVIREIWSQLCNR